MPPLEKKQTTQISQQLSVTERYTSWLHGIQPKHVGAGSKKEKKMPGCGTLSVAPTYKTKQNRLLEPPLW